MCFVQILLWKIVHLIYVAHDRLYTRWSYGENFKLNKSFVAFLKILYTISFQFAREDS